MSIEPTGRDDDDDAVSGPGDARQEPRGLLPRSDEDEVDGRDFAEEHSDLTHADQLRGGPERAVDESVPSGLAGQDPDQT